MSRVFAILAPFLISGCLSATHASPPTRFLPLESSAVLEPGQNAIQASGGAMVGWAGAGVNVRNGVARDLEISS